MRRSCTIEWKNARPNMSLRNSASFVHVSKNSESLTGYDWNVRSRPARSPLGGSLVILTLFSRMGTGKMSDGYDVSHRRNFLWVFSGMSCCSQ